MQHGLSQCQGKPGAAAGGGAKECPERPVPISECPAPLSPAACTFPGDDDAGGESPKGCAKDFAGLNGHVPTWSEEERRSFLIGLHIVNLPGEESVLRFLCDSIKAAPLPAPWVMGRDSEGRVFFANPSTEATTWNHPLEHAVRELAGAFRVCQTLAPAHRRSCVATLHKTWDQEARNEFAKWYSVKHESGRAYYCHREAGEAMWEHPSEVVLPAHYLKIKAIDWLLDEQYFASVCSQQPHQPAEGLEEALPTVNTRGEGEMDLIREELARQLRQTIDAQRTLQEELSSAECELRSEKASHSETKQRALEAEAVLAEERQRIQQCRAECSELARGRLLALDKAREAERAKDALEARLATMDAGVAKSYLKRLAKQGQAASDLNMSLNASLRTLDLATESTPSRIPDLASEMEPPESSLPSSRGEVGSLADVPTDSKEREESITDTGGSDVSAPSADEQKHFEKALMECAELSRSRDSALESAQAALRHKDVLESKLVSMEKTLQLREAALAAKADDLASLQAALAKEQRSRAELERSHRDVEARRQDLEQQMEEAAVSTRALREELIRAEGGLSDAQASGHEALERALKAEEQLAEEREACQRLSADHARAKESIQLSEDQKQALHLEIAQMQDSLAAEQTLRPELLNEAASDAGKQRTEQLREELAEARKMAEFGQSGHEGVGTHREHVLERMQEAERAKASLEEKLASAEKLLKQKEAAWSLESSDLVATLRSELVEEQAFRARLERAQREGQRPIPAESCPGTSRRQPHRSAPPGTRRHPRSKAEGDADARGGRAKMSSASVRLQLKLEAADCRRLEAKPVLLTRLEEALRSAMASAAGGKILPEHVDIAFNPSLDGFVANVMPPAGVSANSVMAKLKAPALFQTLAKLLQDTGELSERSGGRGVLTEVSVSLAEAPPGVCRETPGAKAAHADRRAQREREARRARRALEDAIVLASRIQLLRAEGLRTQRRIRQAQEKTRAIIFASHCAQQFAWPSASRPVTAQPLPLPLAPAVAIAAVDAEAAPSEPGEEHTAPEEGQLVALVLHARLSAARTSLRQSNALLKASLALTAASLAAPPKVAPPARSAPKAAETHELAVSSALKAKLEASRSGLVKLNAALRGEVEVLKISHFNCQLSSAKEGEEPSAA